MLQTESSGLSSTLMMMAVMFVALHSDTLITFTFYASGPQLALLSIETEEIQCVTKMTRMQY